MLKIILFFFWNFALKRFFFWQRWLEDLSCWRGFRTQRSSFLMTLLGPKKTQIGRYSTCFFFLLSLHYFQLWWLHEKKIRGGNVWENVLPIEQSKKERTGIQIFFRKSSSYQFGRGLWRAALQVTRLGKFSLSYMTYPLLTWEIHSFHDRPNSISQ